MKNRPVYEVTASPVDFPTLILKRSYDDLLNFGNSFKWLLSSSFEAHLHNSIVDTVPFKMTLPSIRHQMSYDDCLEDRCRGKLSKLLRTVTVYDSVMHSDAHTYERSYS